MVPVEQEELGLRSPKG